MKSSILVGLAIALTAPLFVLNLGAGLVGLVWLAVDGQWRTILIGAITCIMAPFMLSFLLLPGTLVGASFISAFEKGGRSRALATPFLLLSLSWTFIVMGGWAVFCFNGIGEFSIDFGSPVPNALLAYAVATSPWAYMEARTGGEHATFTMFFFNLACAMLMVGSCLAVPWLILGALIVMILAYILSVVAFGLAARFQ